MSVYIGKLVNKEKERDERVGGGKFSMVESLPHSQGVLSKDSYFGGP